MSQKANESFDSGASADLFYSESNLTHLQRGVDALNAGKEIQHEPAEDGNEAENSD